MRQTPANQKSIMSLVKALTKNVSDDFKLTTDPLPGVVLGDHRHTTSADSFKVFIAVLMITKNSGDFIGGKVVKHILSKELAGVDINAEDRVTAVVNRLKTTGLFKAEFIQRLMDSDLKQFSGNVDLRNTCSKLSALSWRKTRAKTLLILSLKGEGNLDKEPPKPQRKQTQNNLRRKNKPRGAMEAHVVAQRNSAKNDMENSLKTSEGSQTRWTPCWNGKK